jgi:beta-glucosidase
MFIGTDTPSDAELEAIAAADVAVVVTGLTYADEGEYIPTAEEENRGGDRADLDLPAPALQLIRAVSERARKTAVILEGGGSMIVRPFVDDVDALLLAWYPGMEGGTALGRLVFGDVSPSGKLPVSFPRAMSDLPPWDTTSTEVEYGYLHGYRFLDLHGSPEFPFGFGLSYAKFEISKLRLEASAVGPSDVLRVAVDVTNHGSQSADEVVQVFARASPSAYERALRDLVGFRRVTLEPGETKTVHLDVRVQALGVFDEATSAFVVERTDYLLLVNDLTVEFRVE